MCAKMLLYSFSIFSAISWIVVVAEEEVSSPLRVAQCRATCLEKFAVARPSGESSCLQSPDCFMCWENCELLQSNYQVWGAVCEEKDICFPGCKVACKFHAEAARASQTQPVIHTKGEGVMRVSGAMARWPTPIPRSSSHPEPFVYVVMRRAADGPWRQIIQTQALATRVPSNNEGALLRVLVVDPQGLVTIYSPDETWVAHDTNRSDHNEHKWTLKEISLIHQKILVIGEIAWESRIARGVYLVTWEVDGGGLKGNLYTDSTRVTLSLWPDTIYHIQVELVSRSPGIHERSEMMTIDTSRAQRVSTESVQDVKVNDGDRLMSVLVSSMRGERSQDHRLYSELALPIMIAMVMFGVIILIIVLWWQKRGPPLFEGTNLYVGSSSVLKRKLVEDFIPPPHCFQPVLAPQMQTNDSASRDVVV